MTFEFSDTGTCGIGSSCSALSCSKNGSADAPPPKPVVPANSVCDVITIWGQLTGRYVQIIMELWVFCCFSIVISTLCGICPNPHKSIELQFSKNYLTTKDPSLVRIQKIQKFRKIYSPDPDSGSGIPEI